MPTIPTPVGGSWSAPSATSPPSITPCNAKAHWPHSTSSLPRPTRSTTRCERPPKSCAGCGGRVEFSRSRCPLSASEPGAPQLVCVGEPAQWVDLPSPTKQMITSLGDGELLTPDTAEPGLAGIALQHPQRRSRVAHRAVRTTALHRRRPHAAHGARRSPRPRAAAGPSTRPATGNRAGVAERDPRPCESAHRIRGALSAGHPPASGRR